MAFTRGNFRINAQDIIHWNANIPYLELETHLSGTNDFGHLCNSFPPGQNDRHLAANICMHCPEWKVLYFD